MMSEKNRSLIFKLASIALIICFIAAIPFGGKYMPKAEVIINNSSNYYHFEHFHYCS